MKRSYVSWVLSVLLLLVCTAAAFAESNLPKKNTRADIKAYAERAAKVVAKDGPSCAEFKEKDWMGGDYYIFVLGPDDKLVCHPNPSMVAKPASEVVDANGKKVGESIAATGKMKGGGWTDYVWPRPGTTKPVPKSSYSVQVKGPDGKMYVGGAGGYELK
jgi:cytochrome c